MQGLVVKSTGSWYDVYTSDEKVVRCRLRGNHRLKGIRSTNPVAVGDHVEIVPEEGRETAVITQIHERVNYIIRKATNLSRESHIIAANLDLAVLVATLDQPRTSTGFIDRFLVTAEAYHIPVLIVFNKIDLYDAAFSDQLASLTEVYRKIGYEVHTVSALTKRGISQLAERLTGKVSLISGHSGVGKSAILNAIYPGLDLRTGNISEVHNKGKHTTTFAEMFQLPNGGWIVDTPGIKEFGLHAHGAETLSHRFPEMRSCLSACRFANCTHEHEPHCAVKEAVSSGEIAAFRYTNYLNMLHDERSAQN